MKKIWEEFIFLQTILKELAVSIVTIILAKNPCKKCLVKPCCSKYCEERVVFENFILRGDSLKNRKLFAWTFAIYIPLAILNLLFSLFEIIIKTGVLK
jgi:hypothetical protein